MDRFIALDSLRGLHALAVVLFHTYVAQAFSQHPLITHAYLFVEFFFVLSGFVLMHTYGMGRLASGRDYGDFVVTRSARILPLHLALLGLYLLLETGRWLAEHWGIHFNDPAFTGATAPDQLLTNALLLQSWLNDAITGSFSYPAWSISIEFYLYLAFGLAALEAGPRAWPLFLALSLLACPQLLYPLLPLKTEIFRGLSCCFAGTCLYLLYRRCRHWRPGPVLGSLLEGVCVLGCAGVLLSTLPLALKGVVATLVFAATVLAFALEAGIFSRLLRCAPFVQLGMLFLLDLPLPCSGDLRLQERFHGAG